MNRMGNFSGTAHKYGNNINTDIICPGKYMQQSIEEMAKHVMEVIDPDFVRRVKHGDILVGGANFGSGSSRETAPLALKAAGICAIVAKSYARIFYRNCINIGLPALVVNGVDTIDTGDVLQIGLGAGIVRNVTKGCDYGFTPLPAMILEMLTAGGLVAQLEHSHLVGM